MLFTSQRKGDRESETRKVRLQAETMLLNILFLKEADKWGML
jgi:hypothetical protein